MRVPWYARLLCFLGQHDIRLVVVDRTIYPEHISPFRCKRCEQYFADSLGYWEVDNG